MQLKQILFKFDVGSVYFETTEKAGKYEFTTIDQAGQALTGGFTFLFANKSNAAELLKQALDVSKESLV